MAITSVFRALTLVTMLTSSAFAATTSTTATSPTGVNPPAPVATTPAATTQKTAPATVQKAVKPTAASPSSGQKTMPAAATPASTMNTKAAEAMLNQLTKNQVEIVQTFPSIANLQGFVVKAKGEQGTPSVVYVDTQGRYALVGAVLTPDGVNQSEADTQKYINASVAKAALADSPNTAWILDGKADAKHSMYVVADPNCIYCHKMYQMTRPAVASGDLAIRWIWVGFLKNSSAGIAKAILAATDPLAAMAQNETQFNDGTESGGLAPLDTVSDAVNQKFTSNMAFLNKYQFPGTPVLIYQDKQGNPVSRYGIPPDALAATIDGMGTLP